MAQTTHFVRRVRLKNYRSIGACDVQLGPLNFLVGPNGSGKSNFLDALRFVTDSLNQSLDHAIRDRGGVQEVRRRSHGHPNNFAIRLDFGTDEFEGHHTFEVTASGRGAWSVKREHCLVRMHAETFRAPDGFRYRLEDGKVVDWPAALGAAPPCSPDRLFLVNAAGHVPFRAVFDALAHMGFYNLNPGVMRSLQPPDPGHLLKRDGANIASVLSHLDADEERKQRLVEYLGKVSPGIVGVEPKSLGPAETVEFRQRVHGASDPWRFLAQNMSDGTVRALGVLVALHQTGNGSPMPLVGIEEPETALHPAAAGVLLDALRDAASRMQVLATTHSAELLADPDIDDASILAVTSEDNETRIGPIDRIGREAMRERLYTAGELLREDRLRPDEEQARPKQLHLFDGE
ncbi:MAG: AAA family ATPase [Planctomycetes bacterium]|nr:AAA family ATPase [Planctomycetota bacterium]